MQTYVHINIYIERERKRERNRGKKKNFHRTPSFALRNRPTPLETAAKAAYTLQMIDQVPPQPFLSQEGTVLLKEGTLN